MILLRSHSISKYFGADPVLLDVTFDVRSGEKIGLVGPNGTGKSTLLNTLIGKLDPDGGTITVHSNSTCDYLEQQPNFADGLTVWEEAKKALAKLIDLATESEKLARQMGQGNLESKAREAIGRRFDEVQQLLRQHDGFHIDHKIERVLHGLGFDETQFQQPVNQLSGGQQNRLMLGKLLLSEPDLMLLDEPSNHLDIDATAWLEDYLASSNQTLIVVSHDRYFLDKVTNRTLELFHGTVESYKGNYSAYIRQKQERLEVERRTYAKQQEEIAKLEDFIRRHHHGQKHAQAEDRRRKLERLEPVAPPREIHVAPMGFPKTSRSGDVVLRVEALAKSFDQPLFRDVTFDIQRGERWGVIGPNGTGKTTLLRCLLDQIDPDSGTITLGHGARIGYFDQLLTNLDPEAELADAIRPAHKEFVEQQRRDLLARFGIVGDMAFQKVKSLSGGERNRVALASLAAADANFLLLDEPTNHLDLWARSSLEKSLKDFDGTVLFVSHDRFFLNQVADHLLVLANETFHVIHGNYDTFLQMFEKGFTGAAKKQESVVPANSKSPPKQKQIRRKRRFPYRKVEDIESDIFEKESAIERLHGDLASPDFLRDGARVKEAHAEIERFQADLKTLYEHWEEASELN